MTRFRTLAILATLLFCLIVFADAAVDVTAIVNVRIFDGVRVIPKGAVMFQGRTITYIGAKPTIPPGAKMIDGSGSTLLPGLIDSHTHATRTALTRALVFGVTTELDMFSRPNTAAQLRTEQKETGASQRADVYSAGFVATAPKGHGTEYGFEIPTLTRPDEADLWVEERVKEGSDYIKIIIEDGKLYGVPFQTLDNAIVAAVATAAHGRKKLAVAHISTEQAASDALNSGVDGLVHIFSDRPVESTFISLAKKKKAFVTPTLTVVESLSGMASGKDLADDPFISPYLTTPEGQTLRGTVSHPGGLLKNALDAVRSLNKAGVPILAGTDAPNPGTAHGASIHRELELLVSGGLTNAQALAAATSIPASIFGLNDRGRIAAGLRADLILVKGDPTTDIKATRRIVQVWKIGQEISRSPASQ